MVFGKKQIVMATLILALGAAVYLHSTLSGKNGGLIEETGAGVSEAADLSASSAKNYGDTQFVAAAQNGEAAETADNVGGEEAGEPTGAQEGAEGAVTTDALIGKSTDEYFINARLDRQHTRDKILEQLNNIIKDANATDEEKNNAITTAAKISISIGAESNVENLVRAKGFEDCMAYISDGKANIVVKSAEGLTTKDAAQIKDIIVSESGVIAQNITITEVN
ncbi:MAG: SpoIIIAH-like family protein [Oscillospiraceae bacterium]|jgi:stage III sporulation protein AH|nr:SpoIIIAH-like family protein [Oscillospiraceae bacterium]